MQENVRSSYENGLETRSKIVAVAKKLFWRNGYDATGYRDISAANGWSPGLIHYHFKKKQLIGYAVYADIINDIEVIVRDISDDLDALERYVVISFIIWDLASKSEEFSRFMYEISLNRIPVVDDEDLDIYRYREIIEGFGRDVSERDFIIRTHMASAGERELLIDFTSGEYDLDARECAVLDSEMSLRIMGVPEDVTRAVVTSASEFVASHCFEVGESFSINLSC